MKPITPRYPVEPLLAYCARRLDKPPANGASALETLTGYSRRSVYRWHKTGGIPWTAADAIAAILELHPWQIWPEWFEDVA